MVEKPKKRHGRIAQHGEVKSEGYLCGERLLTPSRNTRDHNDMQTTQTAC